MQVRENSSHFDNKSSIVIHHVSMSVQGICGSFKLQFILVNQEMATDIFEKLSNMKKFLFLLIHTRLLHLAFEPECIYNTNN